jgi:hypothetical protein
VFSVLRDEAVEQLVKAPGWSATSYTRGRAYGQSRRHRRRLHAALQTTAAQLRATDFYRRSPTEQSMARRCAGRRRRGRHADVVSAARPIVAHAARCTAVHGIGATP